MWGRAAVTPAHGLLAVTAAVVVGFVSSSVYVEHAAGAIDAMAADIVGNADPAIEHLVDARTALRTLTDTAIRASLHVDQDPRGWLDAAQARRQLHGQIAAYLALPFFPHERRFWQAVEQSLGETERAAGAVMAGAAAGDASGAAPTWPSALTAASARGDRALARLIDFNADQGSRLGHEIRALRHRTRRIALVLHGLNVLLACALALTGWRAARRYTRTAEERRRLAEQEAETERHLAARLEAVVHGATGIAAAVARSDELPAAFQATAEAARTLADADYAALGVGTDPAHAFSPFVTAGIDASTRASLGTPPRPLGTLGVVAREGCSLAIDDVARDPRFGGLPPAHPPIGALLAVPVRHGGLTVASLYIARRPGRPPFSEQDRRVVELLGAFAGTAITNADLYRAVRREVRAREDLLAIVSHDLRNPLSAIGLATEHLARSFDRCDAGADDTRAVATVRRNAERMRRLLNDLLTAARVEAGHLVTIEPTAADAGALVAEALDAHRDAATARGVRLDAHVPADLPRVWCDRGRILQVLANLLGNALKFTPRGGRVAIAVVAAEADALRFTVADTGPGIAPDALPHLFERYWQRSADARRGTGLGLFIAKGIVESHRGALSVESTPGHGARFSFTLPAAGAARSEDTRHGQPPDPARCRSTATSSGAPEQRDDSRSG